MGEQRIWGPDTVSHPVIPPHRSVHIAANHLFASINPPC